MNITVIARKRDIRYIRNQAFTICDQCHVSYKPNQNNNHSKAFRQMASIVFSDVEPESRVQRVVRMFREKIPNIVDIQLSDDGSRKDVM